MAYLVEKDGLTVLEVIGERTSRRRDKKIYKQTVARVFKKGDIITFDILPSQLEQENNFLKKVEEPKPKKKAKAPKKKDVKKLDPIVKTKVSTSGSTSKKST